MFISFAAFASFPLRSICNCNAQILLPSSEAIPPPTVGNRFVTNSGSDASTKFAGRVRFSNLTGHSAKACQSCSTFSVGRTTPSMAAANTVLSGSPKSSTRCGKPSNFQTSFITEATGHCAKRVASSSSARIFVEPKTIDAFAKFNTLPPRLSRTPAPPPIAIMNGLSSERLATLLGTEKYRCSAGCPRAPKHKIWDLIGPKTALTPITKFGVGTTSRKFTRLATPTPPASSARSAGCRR